MRKMRNVWLEVKCKVCVKMEVDMEIDDVIESLDVVPIPDADGFEITTAQLIDYTIIKER